jgi:hypothetical protein
MYADDFYIFLLLAYCNIQLSNFIPNLAKGFIIYQCFTETRLGTTGIQACSLNMLELSKCVLWTRFGYFTRIPWTRMGTVTFPSMFRERAWKYLSVQETRGLWSKCVHGTHLSGFQACSVRGLWIRKHFARWVVKFRI